MTEYTKIATGKYTVASGSLGTTAPPVKVINLPFIPDTVELWNYTEFGTPAQYGVPYAYWNSQMGQGYAAMEVYKTGPALVTDIVTSNGISTFTAGQLLQYGTRQQVVASTKGATTSFQVTAHGYSVGDTVVFEGLYQSATTGMPQMCGPQMTITTITDANNFVVNWNSNNSSYTNLSASPSGAYVKKVLYPFLYAPQVSCITAITTGTTTTIQTADYHNFVVGQEVAFRIPAAWGTTQLNSLPNTVTPGSPIYAYVVSVTDNWTFVVNVNSTGYTAFTTAQSVASVPGLQFPEVLAVGDVNTGGTLISSTTPLYPSPEFPTSTNRVSTINGPAIRGAFVNNTSQGFIIGAGQAVTLTGSYLGGAANDVIYWKATTSDITLSS